MIPFRTFSGERPIVEPLNLEDHQASYCRDCYLHTSGLDPLRGNKVIEAGYAAAKTLFRAGGHFIQMDQWTDFARSPMVQDKFERIYFTQCDDPGLKVVQCAELADNVAGVNLSRLKPPATAPVATLIDHGGADETLKYTAFVVTYVTVRDEETAPSPASDQMTFNDGLDGVTISLPSTTDPDIASMRVYLAIEGEYYLLAEVPATQTTLTVDPLDDDLTLAANNPSDLTGAPLTTGDCDPPPDDLCGLIGLPNGVLAGFTNDGDCQVTGTVHFSKPYEPHCWPVDYRFKIRYKIVALATVPEGVLVLTEGRPSIITGSTPDVMDEHTLETYHSCRDPRSVIHLGESVFWSSPDGVAVYGGRTIKIASENVWSREQWQQLNPDAMLFAAYEDQVVIYPLNPKPPQPGLPDWVARAEPKPKEGFLFNFRRGDIVRLSQGNVHAALYDVEEDCLWLARGDNLERFHEGEPLPGEWISKTFVVAGARAYHSARLIPQAETLLDLYRPDKKAEPTRVNRVDEFADPFWSKSVTHQQPFRLKSAGRRWGLRIGFRLVGRERLRAAFIAQDMREIP